MGYKTSPPTLHKPLHHLLSVHILHILFHHDSIHIPTEHRILSRLTPPTTNTAYANKLFVVMLILNITAHPDQTPSKCCSPDAARFTLIVRRRTSECRAATQLFLNVSPHPTSRAITSQRFCLCTQTKTFIYRSGRTFYSRPYVASRVRSSLHETARRPRQTRRAAAPRFNYQACALGIRKGFDPRPCTEQEVISVM